MKTQQRNFIVEIKSNSRRTAVRQGSIWGTTDLKAMARQAAGVAPQLFEANKEADSAAVAAPDLPGPVLTAGSDVTPAIECEVKALESAEAPVDSTVSADAVDTVSPPESPPILPKAQLKAKHPRKVADMVQAPQAVVGGERLIDELAALEVENHQLKAAFAAYLRQQNRELRVMLERFDAQ